MTNMAEKTLSMMGFIQGPNWKMNSSYWSKGLFSGEMKTHKFGSASNKTWTGHSKMSTPKIMPSWN
jgi:hypothetical protein